MRRRLRRCRVLPRDQQAIGQHIGLPIRALGVVAAIAFEHVFHQKGNDVGQAHSGFFGVGKTSHGLALHHGFAVHFWVTQHGRRVAHSGHRFARGQHGFNQGDGVFVFRQVPQRAMAAGVEHGVKSASGHVAQFMAAGQQRLGIGIGFETAGGVGLRSGGVALGVERRAVHPGAMPA